MQLPTRRSILPPTAAPSADYGLSLEEARQACGLWLDDSQDDDLRALIGAARERLAAMMGSAWPASNQATYYFRGLNGGLLAEGAAVGARSTAPSVILRYWPEGAAAASVIPDTTYRALVRGPDVEIHSLTTGGFRGYAPAPGMEEPVELTVTLAAQSGEGTGTESVRAAMRALVAGLYHGDDPHQFMPIVRAVLPRTFWA